MEMFIATRGEKRCVDNFINQLNNQFLPIKLKGEDGIESEISINLGIRPIQLWEVVFPEECYDFVYNSIWGHPNGEKTDMTHGFAGFPGGKKLSLFAAGFRAALKLEALPKYDEKKTSRFPVDNRFISILGLGIKRDAYGPNLIFNPITNKEELVYMERI